MTSNVLEATISVGITWNRNHPTPKINVEVARREKRAIFPSLIWGSGGHSDILHLKLSSYLYVYKLFID